MMEWMPGPLTLFGSGETSLAGGRILEALARTLPSPLRIAILETPAGFEPNSAQVAGRVADFMRTRLQNYQPHIDLLPARHIDTPYSPNDPAIVQPLQHTSLIFLGPGSPTYAVRQLRHTLAWQMVQTCHQRGAALVLASAATIAVSCQALPVYEIYKVGEDLHWHTGLDLLAAYGLRLVFIPHWNNTDGGADLDTSRCFMGQARMARLTAMLPPAVRILGIDEHTALTFDFAHAVCHVAGVGGVTLLQAGQEQRFEHDGTFPIAALGNYTPAALPAPSLPIAAPPPPSEPPPAVIALVTQRQAARAARDWPAADALRCQIIAAGWQILDTPAGPRLDPTLKE